jgi:hypothetical protein
LHTALEVLPKTRLVFGTPSFYSVGKVQDLNFEQRLFSLQLRKTPKALIGIDYSEKSRWLKPLVHFSLRSEETEFPNVSGVSYGNFF